MVELSVFSGLFILVTGSYIYTQRSGKNIFAIMSKKLDKKANKETMDLYMKSIDKKLDSIDKKLDRY